MLYIWLQACSEGREAAVNLRGLAETRCRCSVGDECGKVPRAMAARGTFLRVRKYGFTYEFNFYSLVH